MGPMGRGKGIECCSGLFKDVAERVLGLSVWA